jgi:hypothetical protein
MCTSADGNAHHPTTAARSLLALTRGSGPRHITLDELVAGLGGGGPAALVLLFALPNVIPMPPGTSAVLGAPLLLLTVQMARGKPLRLPAALGRRSFARNDLVPLLRHAARLAGRGGTGHLSFFVSPLGVRLTGVVCSLLALIVLLPIPFGNMPTALAISVCAAGILRQDGRWVLAGWLAGVVAVLILVGALYGLAHFGVYALQHLTS